MHGEELLESRELFTQSLKDNFPSKEDFQKAFPARDWEACKRFTGLEQEVAYERDASGVAIIHRSINSPSLQFELSSNYLDSNLDNCLNPDLAIVMFFHGLTALKTILSAYNIKTSFLPSILFEGQDLLFKVPLPDYKPDVLDKVETKCKLMNYLEENHCDFKLRQKRGFYEIIWLGKEKTELLKQKSEDAPSTLVARVSYEKHSKAERCELGAHMLILSAIQGYDAYHNKEFEE